jgi:hypothetical protein
VENPQPIRGSGGQTDPGPSTYYLNSGLILETDKLADTYDYVKLNPDTWAPPGTHYSSSGAVPQAQWPLGLSHNRFGVGDRSGWARQQNNA